MPIRKPQEKKKNIFQRAVQTVKDFAVTNTQVLRDRTKALARGDFNYLKGSLGEQTRNTIPQRGDTPQQALEKNLNLVIGSTGTPKTKLGKTPPKPTPPTPKPTPKPAPLSAAELSRRAVNSLENNYVPKPKSLEIAERNLKAGMQFPVRYRVLEDGKLFIEDGRHNLSKSLELGKSVPLEDVSSKYRTPIRGNGGRFNGSTSGKPKTKVNYYNQQEVKVNRYDSEAGFTAFPADAIAETGWEARKQLRPALGAIGAEGGEAGSTLASKIGKAMDVGEVNAGKRMAQAQKAPKLTFKEKLNMTDVLEGRAAAMNDSVSDAVKVHQSIYDDVAREATEAGVKTTRRGIITKIEDAKTAFQREQIQKKGYVKTTVREPFKKRANYFHHSIPPRKLLEKGKVRKQIIDAMVHRGVKATAKEAEQFLDEFLDYVKTGKQQDSLVEYLVETGQSKSSAEAYKQLQKFRDRTIKRGATEYGRNVDLPFFDPDPERVLAKYIGRESKRLAQVKELGQNQEAVNELIKQIKDNGGDADFVRTASDRILDIANNAPSGMAKAGVLIRALQGFKLGLASVANVTQGPLNSWLKGDFRAVMAGLWGTLAPSGKEFALKSGATLDSVLDDATKSTGALKFFLKATGFTATEKFNRRLAASAGRSYGTRLFEKAKNGNRRAIEEMKEFGVDMTNKTTLTDDDILMIAKKFSDITQFRSRAQDLPLFASTESGKMVFQFKNFVYNQTRFMARQTFGELRRGNFGRFTRNMLVIGTVFPIAGEVAADIRAAITGRERESKGLQRYFENLAQVGALGMLYDAIRAGGISRGLEYIVGPAAGDAGDLLDALGKTMKMGEDGPEFDKKPLGKFFTKRVPIVGNRVTEAAFPSKQEENPRRSKPERRRRSKRRPRSQRS